MTFNSWTFVPFILVVLALYYVLPTRWQNRMLLVASCIFYGAWDWRFLLLLLATTSLDYYVAGRIHAAPDQRARRRWLLVSLVSNLGVLGFFKYANFFVDTAASLLGSVGLQVPRPHLQVILPIGISFYTFHAISYVVDVYRGRLEPIRSPSTFLLYVLYFPQLVAGPIARAHDLIPQLVAKRTITWDLIVSGVWLILWGLFKKLVIADNVAIPVDRAFNSPVAPGGVECLLAVFGFAIQIYCDFSGYTDIARGLARLMGIHLMLNFNVPYVSRNPTEFWHRWHISLSTWLRDYLYVPLGGNRHGKLKTYRNLILTMLLGGLWHGAAWTFVLWGLYHGVLLAVHRWWTRDRGVPPRPERSSPILDALSVAGMFQLTCVGWLLFRAGSVGQVGAFLGRIFTAFVLDPHAVAILVPLTLFGAMLLGMEAWVRNADDPRTRPGWSWGLGPAAAVLLLLAIVCFTPAGGRQFIYFQF